MFPEDINLVLNKALIFCVIVGNYLVYKLLLKYKSIKIVLCGQGSVDVVQ